jgi:hypothetical protein
MRGPGARGRAAAGALLAATALAVGVATSPSATPTRAGPVGTSDAPPGQWFTHRGDYQRTGRSRAGVAATVANEPRSVAVVRGGQQVVGNAYFTAATSGVMLPDGRALYPSLMPALTAVDLSTGAQGWTWEPIATGICVPSVVGGWWGRAQALG